MSNLLTSGGRQTKFPILRRSNFPAVPGVRPIERYGKTDKKTRVFIQVPNE